MSKLHLADTHWDHLVSISTKLCAYLDDKGVVYTAIREQAQIPEKIWYGIITGMRKPKRAEMYKLAMALRLKEEELWSFMKIAGYYYMDSSNLDVLFKPLFASGEYDAWEFNRVLQQAGMEPLFRVVEMKNMDL